MAENNTCWVAGCNRKCGSFPRCGKHVDRCSCGNVCDTYVVGDKTRYYKYCGECHGRDQMAQYTGNFCIVNGCGAPSGNFLICGTHDHDGFCRQCGKNHRSPSPKGGLFPICTACFRKKLRDAEEIATKNREDGIKTLCKGFGKKCTAETLHPSGFCMECFDQKMRSRSVRISTAKLLAEFPWENVAPAAPVPIVMEPMPVVAMAPSKAGSFWAKLPKRK